jgi:hypothetical protein
MLHNPGEHPAGEWDVLTWADEYLMACRQIARAVRKLDSRR